MSGCATSDDTVRVEVLDDGRVTLRWCIRTASSPAGGPSNEPRLDELSSLSETADQDEIRRAAATMHRFAAGATMKEAVQPTPYGIGWLRGLRGAVE